MTEVEAYSALRETTEYAMGLGELNISLLTGYLLIAFFIGAKLTHFQVSFVSIVFVFMFISNGLALVNAISTTAQLAESLRDTGSTLAMTIFGAQGTIDTPYFALGISLAMLIGALYFMWSVRHPKAE